MKNWVLLIVLLIIAVGASAQEYDYKFRLSLTDKGKTKYKIEKPQEFLSQKAIDRRLKHNIAINESDLPISEDYIRQIEEKGAIVVAKSKWQRTISVQCNDSAMIDELTALPFVANATFVWKGIGKNGKHNEYPDSLKFVNQQEVMFGQYYGLAYDNIKSLNTETLHKAGFKGKGIDIAVIDAGFNNLPSIEILDNLNIKGYKGFVYGNEDLFQNANQHGLNVVSCIGANKPLQFVGTAPEANLWLLGSEDPRSEYPIEEDYWAAAIEYADSLGAEVVNTSLGYNNFDVPAKSYTHKDLDGKSAFISRSANIASKKGILIVCSAGNSGDSSWRKITPPGDADGVLTVGAIDRDSSLADFSSRGYTADMRVKPDVVALGLGSVVVNDEGRVTYKSGTSFSSPIMCGTVACLWQAFPTLSNFEIMQLVKESSNQYENPDENFGYGIPDMELALKLGTKALKIKGKNRIAYSDNFRLESDGVGLIRIIYIGDNLIENIEIAINRNEKNDRIKKVDSFDFKGKENQKFFAEYSKNLKAKKKELYTIVIKGSDIEKETFNLYF